jgi:acyl-CoA synthetase (NDP forming)
VLGVAPSLETFLRPRSIALFGASDDPATPRGLITRLLAEKGFAGELHLINPSRKEIGGRACRRGIADVGAAVDLAILVIPAEQVLPALRECAALGVRNALILSSGFADGGENAGAQGEIAAIARDSGMRICGPNTVGFYNETAGVAATFSPAVNMKPEALFSAGTRKVGVVAQSGGLGFSLYHRGRLMGLNFSACITTGNEVDLTAADFLDHLAADDDTGAILMFLETVRDPQAFMAALDKAAAAAKPVVVVKVGRSAAANRATVSHTGALAGWDAAYDAMFARHGVTVAEDLGRAVAIVAGFVTNPLPRGTRAGVVTVSGGAGALAADRLHAGGFDVPELSAPLQERIAAMLPSFAATANPVDVTGQATRGPQSMDAIDALGDSGEVDLVVMAGTMSRAIPPLDIARLRQFRGEPHVPLFLYSYTLPSDFGLRALAEAGMVAYTSLDDIVAAATAMECYRRFLDRRDARAMPAETVHRRLGLRAGVIAEHAAKDLLAAHGIAVGRRLLVRDEADIARVPADFYPVAAKIQSADIPHKTEAQGVRLGIADAEALRAAHIDLLAAAHAYDPAAAIDGVLVEPMARPGVEMIVGVVRDPQLGPIVTVGAGGTLAELIKDAVRLQGAVGEAEARDMLRSLRTYPLLDGYRGAPPADIAALAELIARLSGFAADHRDEIAELELNPVLVHAAGEGLTIVDALIVAAEEPR